MRIQALFLLFVTLLVAPTVVHAVSVQSTTSAYVSLRQCVAGETVCDSISRSHRKAIGGMPGSPDAQAVQKDPEFGEATGSAHLSDEPGTANLAANVVSLPAKRNGSTSFMLQRYTNTSDRTQTLTFTGDMTYRQTVPEENSTFPADSDGQSGAFAEMELFTLSIDSIGAGTTAEDNFGIFDGEPPAGYESIDNANTNRAIANVTEQGSEGLSMSAVLKPGDSIWMYALMQGIAANGAVVEATLVTKLAISLE